MYVVTDFLIKTSTACTTTTTTNYLFLLLIHLRIHPFVICTGFTFHNFNPKNRLIFIKYCNSTVAFYWPKKSTQNLETYWANLKFTSLVLDCDIATVSLEQTLDFPMWPILKQRIWPTRVEQCLITQNSFLF